MDPVTLIAMAAGVSALAADSADRDKQKLKRDYKLGIKSAVLPAPEHAFDIIERDLKRTFGTQCKIIDVFFGVRNAFDGAGFDIAWEGHVFYSQGDRNNLLRGEAPRQAVEGRLLEWPLPRRRRRLP
jgi:hypothetical protein